MDDRLIRWLLATILAVFLLILSLSVAPSQESPALVERGLLGIAGAVASTVDAVGDIGNSLRQRVKTRGTLQRDNRELAARVERLEFENLEMATTLGRLKALEQTVGWATVAPNLAPAEVVYLDSRSEVPVWIVRAAKHTWHPGQPVLTADGIAGRVAFGLGSYARVQPITDRSHAFGAMIERTRRQGIVRGGGSSILSLDYIPITADVRLGDQVISAGTDGVFPRGLPVGEVVAVEESDDLLLHIRVRPAIDFSAIETLFLLTADVPPSELRADETVMQ